MKKNYDITIIIPLYNEEQNIPQLVSSLNNVLQKLNNISKQVIIVDDGSTDNSYNLLQKAIFKSFDVLLIKLSRNFGSHPAMRAGILKAEGDYITFLSADLQDPMEIIKKLYQKSREGYDIVLGCRVLDKVNIGRKIISKIYAELIRQFIFPNFPKNNFDIVMFNKKVKKELNKNIEVNSSLFLQIMNLGFKNSYITYRKKLRLSGKSKWTFEKKLKLFIDSFIAFSYIPIRFISLMGILLSFLGFIWALYVIIRAFFLKDIQSGWPTLISVLMIGFGLTNISLGIIAEYIWRTFDVSRNKPTFIIDKIVTLNKNEKK